MQISRTGKSNSGFTLFELLIVVFLVSLMLSLAIPSFTVVGESKIKSDSKKLASVLRYLNDSAVSLKETFTLNVDFRDNLILYKGPEGKKKEKLESISAVELQSKGVVKEGDLIIFFGPLGASEAFSFFLQDNDNAMTVAFNPISGRVKIVNSEQ